MINTSLSDDYNTSSDSEAPNWDDVMYKILKNSYTPYIPVKYLSKITCIPAVVLTFNGMSTHFWTKYSDKLIVIGDNGIVYIGLSSRTGIPQKMKIRIDNNTRKIRR